MRERVAAEYSQRHPDRVSLLHKMLNHLTQIEAEMSTVRCAGRGYGRANLRANTRHIALHGQARARRLPCTMGEKAALACRAVSHGWSRAGGPTAALVLACRSPGDGVGSVEPIPVIA